MFDQSKRSLTIETRSSRPARTDDGFALLSVIWIAGILATAAFVATSAASSRLRTVDALIANAEAEAAADAGVSLAIAAIANRGRSSQAGAFYTPALVCRLNDRTALRVDVSDEAGKIDLNFASDGILRALMTGLGWSLDVTEARIAALHDYIDADNEARTGQGEDKQYKDAGRPAGPRNGPLASIFELGQVLGFDASSANQMYPYVTVHSGQSGVDPLVATAELRALLEHGANGEALNLSKPLSTPSVPSEFRTSSTQYAMTVTSQGVSASGARFVREAVVSFSSASSASRPAQHRIWRWSRAPERAALMPLDAKGDMKPC